MMRSARYAIAAAASASAMRARRDAARKMRDASVYAAPRRWHAFADSIFQVLLAPSFHHVSSPIFATVII